MYAASGLAGRVVTNRLYVYHVASGNWRARTRIPFPVIGPASATVRGRLYCIGGSPRLGSPTETARVQIYQP